MNPLPPSPDIDPAAVPRLPRFRLTRLFWFGLILLIVGSGPLLAVVIAAAVGLTKDPNPNPIGPGILAFLTFWPGILSLIGGLADSVWTHRRIKKLYADHLLGR